MATLDYVIVSVIHRYARSLGTQDCKRFDLSLYIRRETYFKMSINAFFHQEMSLWIPFCVGSKNKRTASRGGRWTFHQNAFSLLAHLLQIIIFLKASCGLPLSAFVEHLFSLTVTYCVYISFSQQVIQTDILSLLCALNSQHNYY